METLDLRFVVPEAEGVRLTETLPPFIPNSQATDQVYDWLREIEMEGSIRRDAFWLDAAHAHLTQLLVHLMRWTGPPQNERALLPLAAVSIMRESLPEGIEIQDLAARLHVSPTHLITVFKSHFGKTPHEFQVMLKLEQIQHALLLTDRPKISHLARRFGWKDTAHFRDVFKKHTGTTPSQFASHHRKLQHGRITSENWIVFNPDIPTRYTH